MLVAFYLVSATPSTTICLNSAIFLAYTCAKLKVLARFIPRQRTRCSTLLYKRTLNQPIIPAIECRRLDPEHLQRSPSRHCSTRLMISSFSDAGSLMFGLPHPRSCFF